MVASGKPICDIHDTIMLYQVIHPIGGMQKTDGNSSIPELLILLSDGSLCKLGATLAEEMDMLYKRLAVIHAMAEGMCPIPLHKSVRQLM